MKFKLGRKKNSNVNKEIESENEYRTAYLLCKNAKKVGDVLRKYGIEIGSTFETPEELENTLAYSDDDDAYIDIIIYDNNYNELYDNINAEHITEIVACANEDNFRVFIFSNNDTFKDMINSSDKIKLRLKHNIKWCTQDGINGLHKELSKYKEYYLTMKDRIDESSERNIIKHEDWYLVVEPKMQAIIRGTSSDVKIKYDDIVREDNNGTYMLQQY